MELKFVDDKIVKDNRGRKASYDFTTFMEELYKFPNQWAEFPHKVSFASLAYRVKEQFKDIEVVCSGGNSYAKDHPKKKLWTVYIRYVPSEAEVF